MNVVRIEPRRLGRRSVPTIGFAVTHRRGGRLRQIALLDTGSAFLVISEALLRQNGFPTRNGSRVPHGVEGISGRTDLFRLDDSTLTLTDVEGANHTVNAPLFFTRRQHVPILGRESLRAFSARLTLDCQTFEGALEVG